MLGRDVSTVGQTRPSEGERERVAGVLRRACLQRRVSAETFSERLDVVYGARTTAELESVLMDVRGRTFVRRTLLSGIRWLAQCVSDITEAWEQPRIPRFVLPENAPVSIGRSRSCDFVVADPAVSAKHAHLARDGGEWVLYDDGSLNGTFVNGWRVVDHAVIRPGDELVLGYSRFVVALASRKRRTFSIPAHA